MTLKRLFGVGEYYHLFNRGSHRSQIFHDDSDRKRFLFYILHYQSPQSFRNMQRLIDSYKSFSGFSVPEETLDTLLEMRVVDLACFCLMPNHFHLLVHERLENGISTYMQRVQGAYTMYFNTKYKHSGHVFEGRFKMVHVESNRQLLYLSAYIHRNPRELAAWRGKEFEYPWSSLQDLTEASRWGGLLNADIIADQFETTKNSNYADFVKTCTAKTLEEELGTFE